MEIDEDLFIISELKLDDNEKKNIINKSKRKEIIVDIQKWGWCRRSTKILISKLCLMKQFEKK